MKKEFKKTLFELGIETDQKIYKPSDKIKIQIPTNYDRILTLNVVYSIFKNKISFLYHDFSEYQDSERTKNVANKLDLTIPSGVGRVDWEINHKTNPALFTLEDNRKILFSLLKGSKPLLKMEMVKKNQNQMIS